MERVYIGVGSNLGDRSSFLKKAQLRVAQIPGVRFLRSSTLYETDPVGGPPQGKYLNGVWEIETSLTPRELKDRLREIESGLGRKPAQPNSSREIDLDILFYGERVIDDFDLKIPHVRLHERLFVLEPLAELAPDKIHPRLNQSIRELLEKQHENHP